MAVQFFQLGPKRRGVLNEALGEALGKGLANFSNEYYAKKALDSVLNDKSLDKAPLSQKMQLLQTRLGMHGEAGQRQFTGALQAAMMQQQEQQQAKEEAGRQQAAALGGYHPYDPPQVAAAKVKAAERAKMYGMTYPELAGGGVAPESPGMAPQMQQQLPATPLQPQPSQEGQLPVEPSQQQAPIQIRTPTDILNNLRRIPTDQLIRYRGHPEIPIQKAIEGELDRRSDEEKEVGANRRAMRQETLPLRMEYINRANVAREGIRNKTHLLQIIDRGQLDDPTYTAFAQALPFNLGQRLLSEDTVEYKGGLIDEFGDLKNIFKGATRVKEVELYEKKIPDLYYTDSQKKAILKSRIDAQKIDLLREEAASEVEEKYPNISALQFTKKVEEIAKPKINALFNQIWDQQKAVFDQAEKRKSLPLDPKDPEDFKIMQEILKEAGGVKEEAKKLARKKGYSWVGGK